MTKTRNTLLRRVAAHREKRRLGTVRIRGPPTWVCFVRVEVASEITGYEMTDDVFVFKSRN